jgi:hypothetical protein
VPSCKGAAGSTPEIPPLIHNAMCPVQLIGVDIFHFHLRHFASVPIIYDVSNTTISADRQRLGGAQDIP